MEGRGRVRTEGRVAFSTFFESTNLRSRIVGLFLAILELLRNHAFRAEQPVALGEIWISPPTAGETESTDPATSVAIERQLPELLADADDEAN